MTTQSHELPFLDWLLENGDDYNRDEIYDSAAVYRAELMQQKRVHPPKTTHPRGASVFFGVVTLVLFCAAVLSLILHLNHRSLGNEVHLLIAQIQGHGLNGASEQIEWNDGKITFLSHELCTPTFRAYQDGTLLPPPSEWLPDQADSLLESERVGCQATSVQGIVFDGTWKRSPWAILMQPVVESPDPKSPSDWQSVWIDYTVLGYTIGDLRRIGVANIQSPTLPTTQPVVRTVPTPAVIYAPVAPTAEPIVPTPIPAGIQVQGNVSLTNEGMTIGVGASVANEVEPNVSATTTKEMTVQAWLASPPTFPTATVMPTEAVPAFKQEFQSPPACSPFLGYVGQKAADCRSTEVANQ